MSERERPRFEEIDVERINVTDPAGRRRVVITHGGRHPDPRRRGRGAPMLFFNDAGDECGGIAFSGMAQGGAYEAGAVIALDQFRNGQCVAPEYEDENGRRRHGLRVAGSGARSASAEQAPPRPSRAHGARPPTHARAGRPRPAAASGSPRAPAPAPPRPP